MTVKKRRSHKFSSSKGTASHDRAEAKIYPKTGSSGEKKPEPEQRKAISKKTKYKKGKTNEQEKVGKEQPQHLNHTSAAEARSAYLRAVASEHRSSYHFVPTAAPVAAMAIASTLRSHPIKQGPTNAVSTPKKSPPTTIHPEISPPAPTVTKTSSSNMSDSASHTNTAAPPSEVTDALTNLLRSKDAFQSQASAPTQSEKTSPVTEKTPRQASAKSSLLWIGAIFAALFVLVVVLLIVVFR